MSTPPIPTEFWRRLNAKAIDEINREAQVGHSTEPPNEHTNVDLADRLLVEFDKRISDELEPFVLNWKTPFPVAHFVQALAPYVSEIRVPYEGPDFSFEHGEWLHERLQAALGQEHASLAEVIGLLQAQEYGLHSALGSHAAWEKQRSLSPRLKLADPGHVVAGSHRPPIEARWENLQVEFRGTKEVTLKYDGKLLAKTDFSGMGFATQRGTPSRAWETLCDFAQGDGIIRRLRKGGPLENDSTKRQITTVKDKVDKYLSTTHNMKMAGNPISFYRESIPGCLDDRAEGWKTNFKITSY